MSRLVQESPKVKNKNFPNIQETFDFKDEDVEFTEKFKGWKGYRFVTLSKIASELSVSPDTVLHWSNNDQDWPVELVFLHPQKRKGHRISSDDYILPVEALEKLRARGFPKKWVNLVKRLRKENEQLLRLLENSDAKGE
jgi:hypothetical protein|tara:strand:+ start:43 stop:459 length:417 start_codon:yes stop_codon:yes gene_type:complete